MEHLPTIVVVDDEPLALNAVVRALRGANSVRTYSDPREALAALSIDMPDVIISDLVMPGMSGKELLERVREAAPNVRRVLLSATADLQPDGEMAAAEFILAKPATSRSLRLVAGLDAERPKPRTP